MLLAHDLELLVDQLVVGERRGARELEPFVVDALDVGLNLEGGLVRERGALLELTRGDLRLIDGGHVLVGESFGQRPLNQGVGHVVLDLRSVEMREHLTRRLARTETFDVRLALQARVRLLDLGFHIEGGDFDGELHHDGGDACNLDVHRERGG